MGFFKKHFFHLINAFLYSFKGLKYAFKNETAFQQEVIGILVSLPILWRIDVGIILKTFILFSYALVLICELANSAIEVTVNRISKERHPLSGAAKDMGSAMVMIAFIPVLILWANAIYVAFFAG